jgi:lactoylglutathione lyase
MAQITKGHHTGFTVSSLERSLAFYRDLLGLEVVFRWNPQAPYLGELVGYPDVDLHAAILRIPGSDTFLELLEYRNVAGEAVDMANGRGRARTALRAADGRRGAERLAAGYADHRAEQGREGGLHDRSGRLPG